MKRLALILFALAACLFTAQSAVAQFETASVLGYVRDSSGAVVPGAKVSLQNTGTKAVETAVTNAQGAYEFTSIKVGDYQVSASANGFDTGSTSSFHVVVNARQRGYRPQARLSVRHCDRDRRSQPA